MTAKTKRLVKAFEQVASEAQTLTFPARASELQEEAVRKVGSLLKELARHKAVAAKRGQEDDANMVLAMELALASVRSELQMWLRLKHDDGERAWDDLVEAANSLRGTIAVRRQLGFDVAQLDNLQRKLLFIERFIFPPQVFNSIGGTVSLRECSICGDDYEECDHIVGRAYMGSLCCRIIRQFTELREVSFVENPTDKRCRVTHFSENGYMRNKMTWRLENRTTEPPHTQTQPPSHAQQKSESKKKPRTDRG